MTRMNTQPVMQTPDPISAPTLSARECQVLEDIAHGRTCRQIGLRLGISRRTVESHLTNSIEKLGVRSRAEAVACALQLGLIRYATRTDPKSTACAVTPDE